MCASATEPTVGSALSDLLMNMLRFFCAECAWSRLYVMPHGDLIREGAREVRLV